jgi:1-deoxy-D-xylulose-5-phosphate synthase
MFTATHLPHPTFIRYPRGPAEGVPIKQTPRMLEVGKAEVVQNFSNNGGRKIVCFALGNMQKLARKSVDQLASQGFDCALINPRFFKPIDQGVHEFFGRAADVVLTLEDHVLMGGYGSAVLEFYSERRIGTPLLRVGWPDQFIEHATNVDDLRKKYGLTAESVVTQVKAAFNGTTTMTRLTAVA